jgi:hypothetical protein
MIPNWKRKKLTLEDRLKSLDAAREKPAEREVKPMTMTKVGPEHFSKILKGKK